MKVTSADVVATVGVVPAASKVKSPSTEALPPFGAAGKTSPYVNGAAEGVASTVGVAFDVTTLNERSTLL